MHNQSINWSQKGKIMVGRFNAPRSPLEIQATLSQTSAGRWQFALTNQHCGLSTLGDYTDRTTALQDCETEAKAMTLRALKVLQDRDQHQQKQD